MLAAGTSGIPARREAISDPSIAASFIPKLQSAYRFIGEWLSLVEHLVRDQGVGGSNPLSPTIKSRNIN